MITPYFQDDMSAIYHGDCMEILNDITDKIDLVVTDPPYEIITSGGGIGGRREYLSDIKGFTDCGFDMNILDRFDNWFCFCSKDSLIRLLQKAEKNRWMLITWNKPNPAPLSNGNYLPDTEYIVHSFQPKRLFGEFENKSRYIIHPCQSGKTGHPNEKPVKVIKKLVALGSENGDTVLDMFMGSGTTLVAAKELGRKSIGIEREERYCELAARKMTQNILPLEFS